MEEKRKYNRVTVILNASYLNTMIDVTDICEGGMQIKSKVKVPTSQNIQFFVFLNDLEMIKVTGEIAWQKESSEGGYISGIKFVIESDKDFEALKTFLKEARG